MIDRIAGSMTAEHVMNLFGTALDRAGIAYSLWDSEDQLLAYNDIYVRMFFAGSEHIVELGQTFERQNIRWGEVKGTKLQFGDLDGAIRDRLKRHREPGGSFERYVENRWIRSTETRTADGGLLSIHVDITHEKERESAAQEGERRFRSLVENLHSIVFCRGIKGSGPYGYDENGPMVYGRDTARLFGNIDEDGKSQLNGWYGAIHPEDRPRYIAAEEARKKYGRSFDIEYRFRHPTTGAIRWAREVAWLVEDKELGRTFLDSYIIDITDSKEREAALSRSRVDLIRAMQQADSANRAKSAFLASMSHELRTPLNAVIGFGEVIAGELVGAGVTAPYRNYAELIVEGGRHLLDVINDILDLSKVEAGKMEIDETDFRVSDVMNEVHRLLGEQIGGRLQTLSVEIPADDIRLRADRRRILQILVNLVGNASKYSPLGGLIVLSCRTRRDGALELIVADQGPGMSQAEIQVALTLFGQASAGRSHKSGTGLGLPLARSFAELHGGELIIESKQDKGTTIRVVIPADRVHGLARNTGEQLDLTLG
jgi:signal transduction histidine kinase